MKYRDTSKIVTFYTQELGKVAAIVKGARQSKNKYGSALEPMSYVSLVLYQKDGREIQTVSSCDRLKPLRHLTEDLEKMAIGLYIVEIMNHIAHEQEKNISLFTLLVDSLNALDNATKNVKNLFYNFELKLAGILGVNPTFDSCVRCGETVVQKDDAHIIEFHLDKGGPLCQNHRQMSGHKQRLPGKVLSILERISSSASFDEVVGIVIEDPLHEQIQNCLWSYMQFHVTGIRPLKTKRVFSSILGTS